MVLRHLFIYSDNFCLEINLCIFFGHLLAYTWGSPCQNAHSESTELRPSINRFLPTVILTNRHNMTDLDLASSLLFFSPFYAAALPTQHWLSHFSDFLLEKFGACYAGTCQFEHKTSPCGAVCLCDTTQKPRNSHSIVTRSLPASKWDWLSWNAPNELSSLEHCWQMDFCSVLFSVHIQGGFWESKCSCSWFHSWPHLSTLLMWRYLTASDLVKNWKTSTANSTVSHRQEYGSTRGTHCAGDLLCAIRVYKNCSK